MINTVEEFRESVARSNLFNNFDFGLNIYFEISFISMVDSEDIKNFLDKVDDKILVYYLLKYCSDISDLSNGYTNEDNRYVSEAFSTDDLFEERISKIGDLTEWIVDILGAYTYITNKYSDVLYCDMNAICELLEDSFSDNGIVELYSIDQVIDILTGKQGDEIFAY